RAPIAVAGVQQHQIARKQRKVVQPLAGMAISQVDLADAASDQVEGQVEAPSIATLAGLAEHGGIHDPDAAADALSDEDRAVVGDEQLTDEPEQPGTRADERVVPGGGRKI